MARFQDAAELRQGSRNEPDFAGRNRSAQPRGEINEQPAPKHAPWPTAMERALALRAGRWEEAASLYEQIARANPSHFEALYSLGMMYLQMQRFEDAQQTLGSALKMNPRFAEGFCARGIVLLQMRRREEAIECFDRALAIMPDFVDALSSRATALLEVDRLEEALVAFDRVLAFPITPSAGTNAQPLVACPRGGLNFEGAPSTRSATAAKRDSRL
jgi:tetratricopeptide (TPR) repeat protein